MNDTEKLISTITKAFPVGVDYSNQTDHTAVSFFDSQAELILSALREKQERDNPKPLTLDELRKRNGKPVYCVEQKSAYPIKAWGIVYLLDPFGNGVLIDGTAFNFEQGYYGKTWLAYDSEPKEDK